MLQMVSGLQHALGLLRSTHPAVAQLLSQRQSHASHASLGPQPGPTQGVSRADMERMVQTLREGQQHAQHIMANVAPLLRPPPSIEHPATEDCISLASEPSSQTGEDEYDDLNCNEGDDKGLGWEGHPSPVRTPSFPSSYASDQGPVHLDDGCGSLTSQGSKPWSDADSDNSTDYSTSVPITSLPEPLGK